MAKNMNDFKPVRIALEVIFDQNNRRVTPTDMERAARAAMQAAKVSLETTGSKPYKIKSITGTVEYLYVQVAKSVSLKTVKHLVRKAS